jgi:hypothetical protein
VTEFAQSEPVPPGAGPAAGRLPERRYANPDPTGAPSLDAIDVALEGGPVDLPAELRQQRVASDSSKIKVRYYGGYEHFERVPAAVGDGGAAVFRWTGRTRIAE